MLTVPLADRHSIREAFLPDRPGPLVGLHVAAGGYGELYVDRWPDPRAALARAGMDYQFAGDANALTAEMLGKLEMSGTVDAPPPFAALLRDAYPEIDTWQRVIQLIETPTAAPTANGFAVRRLVASDAPALAALPSDLRWISAPYDSPGGAAGSGLAFGAFDPDDTLAAVVLPFHIGERYEDLGIVTLPWARRRGAGLACASRVVEEVASRGRLACWSTTPDNEGSLAVAARLGARHVRDDILYIVNWPDEE